MPDDASLFSGAPDLSRLGLLDALPEEVGLVEPLHPPRPPILPDGTLVCDRTTARRVRAHLATSRSEG